MNNTEFNTFKNEVDGTAAHYFNLPDGRTLIQCEADWIIVDTDGDSRPVSIGWTKGDGSSHEGYRVEDYFAAGVYQGPDEHGIEPEVIEARATYETILADQMHSENFQAACFRSTWPNGNEPDGETVVAINVHGSKQAGGFILICDDNNCGGDSREAGEEVYDTLDSAVSAAIRYANEHDEAEAAQ